MKDIVENSFKILDQQGVEFPKRGNATRSKLVEAFSQHDVPVYKYLGYSEPSCLSKVLNKALGTRKPKGVHWGNWIYSLSGYFLCPVCTALKTMDNKKCGKTFRCKECHAEANKSTREINVRRLYALLSNSCCVDCGIADPIVLEFDHLDPSTKTNNVSNMLSLSWKTIQTEIDKCDIVCANCHRRRTAKQFSWYKLQE